MIHPYNSRALEPLAQALGSLSYGLYFLTAGDLERPGGLLVSWVSQVSGDPPMILCAVRENRSLLPQLESQAAFCLNLLPSGRPDLLGLLARPAEQRFQGLEIVPGPLDLPVLAQGLGGIACLVREVWRPGDHALVLGEVAGLDWWGGGEAMRAAESGHPYLGLA